jgi:hypothetical protein
MPAHANDGGALRRTWKAARAGGADRSSRLHLEAMKTERDVVERLGSPDEIVRPEDRMRSRGWLCSTCGTVATAAEPVPIPAPCTKCGGISFETVESPLQ